MPDETPLNPSSATAEAKYPWRTLLVLLLFTAFVRGGVLWLMPDGLSRDPDDYRDIAENLANSGAYAHTSSLGADPIPTAYRPPLYPLVLSNYVYAGTLAAWRVGLLHWVLGVATVFLTFHTARCWQLPQIAFVAGLLIACDPILLKSSTEVMTETLATFLAILGLYTLARFHTAITPFNAALAGGALALAELCRPALLVWLVLAAIAVPLKRTTWMRRLANTAAFLITAATLLAPWAVRNYRDFGAPILTTTNGGATLIRSNNRAFYRYLATEQRFLPFPTNDVDRIEIDGVCAFSNVERRRLFYRFGQSVEDPEITLDREDRNQTIANMREDPSLFAYSCAYRLRRLWGLWPYPTEDPEPKTKFWLRQATAAWYGAEWICGLVGAWTLGRRLWQSPWLWGSLLVVAISGVHTFYWTDLRMRAPLMPFVALVAAVGAERILIRLRGFKRAAHEAVYSPRSKRPDVKRDGDS